MRRRHRSRRIFWVSLGLLLLGSATAVALVACLAQPDRVVNLKPHQERMSAQQEDAALPVRPHEDSGTLPTLRVADLPQGKQEVRTARRLKVGGAEGFYVVLNLDGSSTLEGPGGQRTPLAGAGELHAPPAEVPGSAERLKPPVPPKKELGQLIICDQGVVDVPVDAIVTFVGKDKVVTHAPNGVSVVYHVNGRVEYRGRAEHNGREEAASTSKKE